ncbi:hypothetical protein L1887_36400 [Cichorium endivia]|nr:hypothetical protein L1887_36400 [Cichorium endivia]
MFSSNPSLQIPSSVHVSLPFSSFFDLEKNGYYFSHHEHNINPFVSADLFLNSYKGGTVPPPSPPPVTAAKDLIGHQQLHQRSVLPYCDDYDDLLESVVYPSKKKTVTIKKDGHTKIYTAQGPRDRRVRLSIDIARKFFELQNLLGFDKASETLDWLFTKSKVAIRELVEETKHSSSSTFSTDHCESAFLDTINGGSDEDKGQNNSAIRFADGKKKKTAQKYKSGCHVELARDQIRADARARARERTKEKLRIKKLQDQLQKYPDEYSCHAVSSSNLELQSSFWGQIESQSDYSKSIVEKRFFM